MTTPPRSSAKPAPRPSTAGKRAPASRPAAELTEDERRFFAGMARLLAGRPGHESLRHYYATLAKPAPAKKS